VSVAGLLHNTHPALAHCWHPVARSNEISDQPTRVVLLGVPLVLYRSGGGVVCFEDRCPHRHSPLSLGACEGGVLQCAYHGWRFGRDGRCVEIPALGPDAVVPPTARLTAAAAVTDPLFRWAGVSLD